MVKIEGLTEYDFKNWLIKNGVDPNLVEHEKFKGKGILNYLLNATGFNPNYNDNEPFVTIEDESIKITYPRSNLSFTLGVKFNRGIYVYAIHEKADFPLSEKSRGFNVKQECHISVSKDEENLKIGKGYVDIVRDSLRFRKRIVNSSYNSAGIEMKHEIKEKEELSFFKTNVTPDEIRRIRYELSEPIGYRSSESIECEKKFLEIIKREHPRLILDYSDLYLKDPDYHEKAQRQQYDVASVYIENKQSRFFPDKKDIVYSGYVPLYISNLTNLEIPYIEGQTFNFDAPEISAKTEEQIKNDIASTAATEKQKAALYDMAVKQNRTEFSYSYLDDPKYTNQSGIKK